jgi:asparagine synthase (glutamine-hydrolysing)
MYYINFYLPDLVCSRADKAGMLNSLEIRAPFLNSKILEFSMSLPPSFKANFFNSKIILRDILRTKINNSLIDKSKIGFTFPLQDWLELNKNFNFKNLNNTFINKLKKDHLEKKVEYRNFFHNLNALEKFL